MNTTGNSSHYDNNENHEDHEKQYHTTLLVLYSVVLVCSTICLSMMTHILRSRTASVTSCAVLNLVFAHFIFLLTVPFRIYYYATDHWNMDPLWCKIVSAMIHVHMYMSFMLYVVILVTRLLPYYYKKGQMASFNGLYAFIISILIWIIVLVATPLIIHYVYGKGVNNPNKCFHFAESMNSAKPLNYIISTFIIVVSVALTGLQANVLWRLYRKYNQRCMSEQEFGAQLKSLLFALVILACLFPYHIFRLYYIEHTELENINEVLLSLTTFNCLDMLTFLGKRPCSFCLPSSIG